MEFFGPLPDGKLVDLLVNIHEAGGFNLGLERVYCVQSFPHFAEALWNNEPPLGKIGIEG